MKVSEFIKWLKDLYSDKDELYFTMTVNGKEFAFSNVVVNEKDNNNETSVALTLTDKQIEQLIEAALGQNR